MQTLLKKGQLIKMFPMQVKGDRGTCASASTRSDPQPLVRYRSIRRIATPDASKSIWLKPAGHMMDLALNMAICLSQPPPEDH
jgi:hypothetical protein